MSDLLDPEVEQSARSHDFIPTRFYKPVSPIILSSVVQFFDFCSILVAARFASQIYLGGGGVDAYLLAAITAAIVYGFMFRHIGGYTSRHLLSVAWQINRVSIVWPSTIALLTTIAFVTKVGENYSRGWAITWVVTSFAELAAMRMVLYFMLQRWRRQGRLARTVAVVGAGLVGEQLIWKLKSASEADIRIAGVFDDRLTRVQPVVAGQPLRGTTDDLIAFAQHHLIDEIIIALPLRAAERIGELVNKLRLLPVDLRLSIDPIAGAFPMRGISETGSTRVIEILDRPLKHWSGVFKSIEDVMLGIVFLVLAGPLMAMIALAIKLDSKGPVLFVQDRFGFNNRPIRVFKFRTMHCDRGDPTGERRTVPNDPRVTRVGSILRNLSLDELPQLFNVIRREMSLVGPRPHAVAMRAGDRLYHDAVAEYFNRHRVRPGMTGWAQVHGLRGEIDSVEKARERIEFDLHYIDHWSLWLDIKILAMTVWVLVLRQNAY